MIRRFACALALCVILAPAAVAQPTITVTKRVDIGDSQLIVANITMDALYPHEGEQITAEQLGFRVRSNIYQLQATVTSITSGATAVQWVPDPTLSDRGKLRMLAPAIREDFTLTPAGLAIGGTTSAVAISEDVAFVVGGTIGEVAAADVAFTATTHDIANNADTAQEAWYVYTTDNAGSVTVTQGTVADVNTAVPPAPPAGEAVIGYVEIIVAAGATPFNATTDLLSAAHLTVAFRDAENEVLHDTDLSAVTLRIVAIGR